MLDKPEQNRAAGRAPGRHLRAERSGAELRVAATGAWTVRQLQAIEAEMRAAGVETRGEATRAALDLSAVETLDTAGAWLVVRLLTAWREQGLAISLSGVSDERRILLDEVRRADAAERPPARRDGAMRQLSADTVDGIFTIARDAVRLTAFLGEATAAAARVALRPWRFRWTSFAHHMERAGLRAVPIISLICFLIGAVIMQQGIVQLRFFGAEALAVDMLGVLALREVGVLLCAIMVAGRSASAFTAEIGTMKMREEIDALRTLGIDPIETLALPRILALVVVLPLLVFISDMMCLLGGALMAYVYLGYDLATYFERLNAAIELRHFFVGLVKAPFAAIIIGVVGCLEGFSVTGSAESVGKHVTSAVVKAIFLVMALDGAFAIFLSASGY